MKTSKNGIDLIKQFEGLSLTAYRCPAGVLTIGYGHTGKDVTEGLTVTEPEAERLLIVDLETAEKAVQTAASQLNQNQFDALVSFTFNVGVGNFNRSTLLKCVKANLDNVNIQTEFMRWTYARGGKRLDGLLRRRRKESELYFKKIV
jgi:lysozyme